MARPSAGSTGVHPGAALLRRRFLGIYSNAGTLGAAVPVMSATPSGLDSDDSSSAHDERGSSVLSDWYEKDSYGTMSETTSADSDNPQDFDGFQCKPSPWSRPPPSVPTGLTPLAPAGTFDVNVIYNSDWKRAARASLKGVVPPETAERVLAVLPAAAPPCVSVRVHDVVLEAYESSACFMAGDRESAVFYEQGGIIVDAAGKPSWQIGKDLVDHRTNHTVVCTLLSIFPCKIRH